MSLQTLNNAIQEYTAAIKNYVDVRLGRALVSETVVITAGSTQTYDQVTLIGANHADYDKLSATITVKVLDTDAASPTYDLYINSEAVVTTGVNAAGQVVIHNHAGVDITTHIRIDVPRLV